MNSKWLEYVLTGNKTGKISIGGQAVDFAYLIPYIRHALDFCREREETVRAYLLELDAKDVLEDTEWPVRLSEWMLEKGIHNFSAYRTKQFIRFMREEDGTYGNRD